MLANPISGFLIDGCFLIPSRKAARVLKPRCKPGPIVKENKLSMLYSVGASDHDMSCEDIAPVLSMGSRVPLAVLYRPLHQGYTGNDQV